MQLVFFSDLHLDAAFAWMGMSGDAARARRQAQREVLRRIAQLAHDRGADALLSGGDLYEQERFTADTGEFLRRTFAELDPLPVFLAPGNHDWYGPRSLYARIDWSPNVHIFREPALRPVSLTDGVTLWGAAHCAPVGTPNFLEAFRTEGAGDHLALFHGSERGSFPDQGEGKALHAPFDPAEIGPAGFLHALVGHYHRPKLADRHTYPGNPEPLSFGEDGERGAVVVSIDEQHRLTRETVAVAATAVHDVRVDVTGCGDRDAVRELVRSRLDGLRGVARVRVGGELAETVDLELRDLSSLDSALDAIKYEFVGLRVAYDFERIAGEPTVSGEFVREVMRSQLAEDERRRVLVTGLRALAGRSDLEVD